MSLVLLDKEVMQGRALLKIELLDIGTLLDKESEELFVVSAMCKVTCQMEHCSLKFIYHVRVCLSFLQELLKQREVVVK
jgi:hypothetical protein